jgi:hypothetical protein
MKGGICVLYTYGQMVRISLMNDAILFSAIATGARWVVGAFFLIFALKKLPDRPGFVFVVVAYRVLPRRWAEVYGYCLPWLELCVGGMLVLGILPRVFAFVAAFLLISFLVAIGLNIMRRRTDLSCGCAGGSSQQKIGSMLLLRNLALLLLAVVCMFSTSFFVWLPEQAVLIWLLKTPWLAVWVVLLIAGVVGALVMLIEPLRRQYIHIYHERE